MHNIFCEIECVLKATTHTQFLTLSNHTQKNIYAIDCTTHNSSHAHNFCKVKRLSKFSSFRTSRENSMVGAELYLYDDSLTYEG